VRPCLFFQVGWKEGWSIRARGEGGVMSMQGERKKKQFSVNRTGFS